MGVKNAFLGRLLASSDKFSDEQVSQTINLLIEHAVTNHASDIHIEPHDRFVQVRYRIDNVLRSMHKLPLAALPAVVMQLKEQARLKTGQDHLPQEGQYAALVGEEQFEIQVYTMPVIGGEKAVLHLSRRLSKPPTLAQLGFWGNALHDLQQALTATHGLIVVATPRRNGKTTTLHSILQTINSPAISMATVEDSIEFRLPGASQTIANTRHGVNTATGLQAVLNQDPNVVMLSNLPDRQTANGAIQAAVGGHVIIAGMHADNAAKAVTQLQTMNDEDFLFASALKAAVSQRLVRHLCPDCAVFYAPQRDELHGVEKAFGIASQAARQKVHQLEQRAIRDGLGGSQKPATTPGGITHLWRASPDGCEHCNHTGYQGAIAIVEVLSAQNNDLETALLAPITADKVRKLALKDDFIPMELDGLIKALRGQTTLTELLRTLSM
jgi:type II secretory ATPase GspE/PulE/Tfp pilus assembly ATPase PilB-like protein